MVRLSCSNSGLRGTLRQWGGDHRRQFPVSAEACSRGSISRWWRERMRVAEILAQYPDPSLDRLASDKIDEVANLRLPRPIVIEEIASALSSLSYVALALAPSRPPTYTFLRLLLDAPDHRVPVLGFREQVERTTDDLSSHVAEGKGLPSGKDYDLYLRILYAAWENEGSIDRSEALLLSSLRKELGLWAREHLLLEHHPTVRPLWQGPKAYDEARNHLLASGLVLTQADHYVVAEEVCQQIRSVWEIELEDPAYGRLLELLTGSQLREILDLVGLPLSGSKEERILRVVQGLVPPVLALDTLHIKDVRELNRGCGLPVSGAKADLISSLIDHFDTNADLQAPDDVTAKLNERIQQPEQRDPRTVSDAALSRVLSVFSVDQLYDALRRLGLRRSGSKADRITRLVESTWSDRTILSQLRRLDLVAACRRLGVPVSGVKDEIIDRLCEWAAQERDTHASETAAALVILDGADESSSSETNGQAIGSATGSGPPAAPAKIAPPRGLHDVHVDYPQLKPDEQLILALVKDAKSLTERDVERAADRHQLGWFLIKAHMADLLARLADQGGSPLRVRSVGGLNIYEWHDAAHDNAQKLDRGAARDVIDALRQGVVPERHLDLLAVGQDAARRHLVAQLEHVQGGKSAFKFLRGPYGSGKTFFCSWLREQAFARDFAVSTVRVGPDQPISDLPVFFAGLVNGLRTPEKRASSALADVLESWLLGVHRRTAQLEGVNDPTKLAALVEARIGEELDAVARHDVGFAAALRSFYRARLTADQATAATVLAWLRGSGAISGDALRKIGVRGKLEVEEVFPRFRALLEIISGGRLRGLLLLVDELELVRRLPHSRQREQSYETMRLLIDEAGENDLPGCLLIFTGTDPLFESERDGIPSYKALLDRVSFPEQPDSHVSMRQPVIRLEAIDRRGLTAVAQRVRRIHGAAYQWAAEERVADVDLERLVAEKASFAGEDVGRLPRPFLRHLVNVLDLCEENPSVAASDFLTQPPSAEAAGRIVDLLAE